MQALDTTCLDNTASYETKFPLAKKAAGIFVDNIMSLTTNQVRVGVTAPKACKIWREELYQTIQANKQAAAPAELPKANLKSIVKKLSDGANDK